MQQAMLRNEMQALAQLAVQNVYTSMVGTVTAVGPDYRVKVKLEPGNISTGWLTVSSPWVGDGWGMVCPLGVGNQVRVLFEYGQLVGAFVSQPFFSDNFAPPAGAKKGECWLVHQSGSSVKITNDGKVSLKDAAGTVLSLSNDGYVTITGKLKVSGNVEVAGQITGTGGMAISGGSGATVAGSLSATGDVKAGSISLQNHTHGNVQNGGGNTGVAQ
jgi:phage baseplate assembly protein V